MEHATTTTGTTALADAIALGIRERTAGRLRESGVTVTDDAVVVRGIAPAVLPEAAGAGRGADCAPGGTALVAELLLPRERDGTEEGCPVTRDRRPVAGGV